MLLSNAYNIPQTDNFSPINYPKAAIELDTLRLEIMHLPLPYRFEIVIASLKGQTLDANWIELNPELSAVMKSPSFPVAQLKYLLATAQNNPLFLNDFEQYIKSKVLNLSTVKWTVSS